VLLCRVNPRARALLPLLAFLLAGCGGQAEPKRVPDLRGDRLDVAERRLEAMGLEWEEIGGGNLGILVRSNWTVCAQRPKPGRRGTAVRLVVERSCPSLPPVVPDLVGLSLEDAEERLDAAGISHEISTWGEGIPRIEQLWKVCDQSPRPGQPASFVRLYVTRLDCD
jgi:beta-lactam-binding protein with PASTA domain